MFMSIALPGAFAFVLTLAAAFLPRTFNACGKRRWQEDLLRCVFGAVAIGGGFLISFRLQEGLPAIPPTQRWHWLALMAAAAAIVGCIHGLYARSLIGRVITGLALGAIAMLMLQPLPAFENHWLWKAGLGVGVFMLWIAMDSYALRRPGHLAPLGMMLTFSAASVALVLAASSAKFAMLVASLACMSGAIFAVTLVARKFSIAGGAMAVMATMLPAWMMMAHFYDYEKTYPPIAFALIAIAPLALWLGELKPVKRLGGWKSWLVTVAAVVVVLGAGAGLMIGNAPPAPEQTDDEFDYGY